MSLCSQPHKVVPNEVGGGCTNDHLNHLKDITGWTWQLDRARNVHLMYSGLQHFIFLYILIQKVQLHCCAVEVVKLCTPHHITWREQRFNCTVVVLVKIERSICVQVWFCFWTNTAVFWSRMWKSTIPSVKNLVFFFSPHARIITKTLSNYPVNFFISITRDL